MHQVIMPISLAPLVTGHPLGLPEPRRAPKPSVEITPITKRGDVDTAVAQARTPAEFWRAVSGRPHADQAAPPSMLQIRISQLLRESDPEASAPDEATEPASAPPETERTDARPQSTETDGQANASTSVDAQPPRSAVYAPLPEQIAYRFDKAS